MSPVALIVLMLEFFVKVYIRTHFLNFYNYCTLAPCSNGSVRLGDGGVLKGRVEVCYNGSWVTICTHSWTVKEATVICSQLGYSHYGRIMISKSYSINIHVIPFRCYCSI